MELGLDGRVAMVAAASKGIGRAVAVALAAEGCRVSICARTPATLEDARAEIAAAGCGAVLASQADVASGADLERWWRETEAALGPVDIVVTNTGGPPAARFLPLTDAQWEDSVQSTLLNVVRLSRLAIPGMTERGWGRLIHLTSLVAREPSDDLTISSTLRAGIGALTRTLSNQVAASGITVNAVLPGNTLTDRQRHLARVRSEALGITPEEALDRAGKAMPIGRLARPEEIADAVCFLASARASAITGVSLLVDGGQTRGAF